MESSPSQTRDDVSFSPKSHDVCNINMLLLWQPTESSPSQRQATAPTKSQAGHQDLSLTFALCHSKKLTKQQEA